MMNDVWWLMNILYWQIMPYYTAMMKYDGWWPCCSHKSCHSTLQMMKYDGWPTSRVTIQRFTILLKHLNYATTIFREKKRHKHVHEKTALFRTLDTAYSRILSKTDPHCPAWSFSCIMWHTECRRQPTVVYQVRFSLSCKERLWHWNSHTYSLYWHTKTDPHCPARTSLALKHTQGEVNSHTYSLQWHTKTDPHCPAKNFSGTAAHTGCSTELQTHSKAEHSRC